MFNRFSFYQPTKGLRKIIRMTTIQGTMQLCSAYGKGEYVDINRDSFEFNGIPFVELTEHRDILYTIEYRHEPVHYRTLLTIVATVDTHTIYLIKNT